MLMTAGPKRVISWEPLETGVEGQALASNDHKQSHHLCNCCHKTEGNLKLKQSKG